MLSCLVRYPLKRVKVGPDTFGNLFIFSVILMTFLYIILKHFEQLYIYLLFLDIIIKTCLSIPERYCILVLSFEELHELNLDYKKTI